MSLTSRSSMGKGIERRWRTCDRWCGRSRWCGFLRGEVVVFHCPLFLCLSFTDTFFLQRPPNVSRRQKWAWNGNSFFFFFSIPNKFCREHGLTRSTAVCVHGDLFPLKNSGRSTWSWLLFHTPNSWPRDYILDRKIFDSVFAIGSTFQLPFRHTTPIRRALPLQDPPFLANIPGQSRWCGIESWKLDGWGFRWCCQWELCRPQRPWYLSPWSSSIAFIFSIEICLSCVSKSATVGTMERLYIINLLLCNFTYFCSVAQTSSVSYGTRLW